MVSKAPVLRCSALRLLIAVAAVAAGASLPASAATSSTTDAEQLYRQMRKSSDRATQLLGERWYGLVKRQEWTDESGKFTVTARYLEHDPDLKWVKLRAERTTDGGQEVKDITVPLERLNKTCQSRVRQIAKLESKVQEAAAAAEQEVQERAEERERDRQGGQRGEQPAFDGSDQRAGRRDAEGAESPSPESWPTSYDAFRANFTVQRRSGQYQVDWGTLGVLQQAHDALYSPARASAVPGPWESIALAAQLASVGEFTWEAKLIKAADDGNWAERLDLAPLPEPLSLELVLDRDSGNWEGHKVGDDVRLTGRFVAFAGQYKIVAAIRFSERTSARRSSR
jgi:hypothetical protein